MTFKAYWRSLSLDSKTPLVNEAIIFRKCSGSGVNAFYILLFLISIETYGATSKPFIESAFFMKS
jgi:hypothetical protein